MGRSFKGLLPAAAVSCTEAFVSLQFIKKANRQERVVEEVKLAIKPHYNKGRITKDEYKDIMRRAVPKVRVTATVTWGALCALRLRGNQCTLPRAVTFVLRMESNWVRCVSVQVLHVALTWQFRTCPGETDLSVCSNLRAYFSDP